MSLFNPSWVFVATAVFLAITLARSARSKKRPADWRVVTVPASNVVKVSHADSYDWRDTGKTLQLGRSVLVRVEQGSQSVTIAAIDIGADDFDEQVSEAQSRAAERAAVLNAYVGAA